jgi:predicted ATP-dependent endonuclease of OLD family
MSNSNKPTYISHVHLKGYKSIRDLSIDLLPGLNIIIGPNGSGKTNFLTFLEDKFKDIDESNSTGAIEFIEGETVVKLEYSSKKSLFDDDNTSTERTFGDVINDSLRQPVLFKYGIPEKIFGIDEAGFISLDASTKQSIIKFSTRYLEKDAVLFFVDKLQKGVKITAKTIETALQTNKKLVDNLRNYTPIQGFRIKQGFPVTHKPHGINLDFLMFEFLVNGEWLPWIYLSDGTKRLFHLVENISSSNKNIFLIEEPELGIHPNQLYKLMRFLELESANKQIILTTHSPDVLHLIQADQLERIVITRFDAKKGTLMHKLSEKQQQKAQNYMNTEGLWLSDFWVHSNLEELVDETEED